MTILKRLWSILILIFALGLAACSNAAIGQPTPGVVGHKVSVNGGSYTDIGVTELQTMLANKDFTFINVHTPFAGNIAPTDMSIAYDQIEQNLGKLPSNKDARIVLYCRSGRMSKMAAETMVKLGYTHVWNLSGGMVDWEQAGLKIDR